jgi:hypothetical protein
VSPDNEPFAIHPAMKIGHVHLTVSDIQQSLQFYHSILAFKLVARKSSSSESAFFLVRQLQIASHLLSKAEDNPKLKIMMISSPCRRKKQGEKNGWALSSYNIASREKVFSKCPNIYEKIATKYLLMDLQFKLYLNPSESSSNEKEE